jgi:hypothetical protein
MWIFCLSKWGEWSVVGHWISNPGRGKRFLFSAKRPDMLLGPPSPPCNGYWAILPGVNRLGHEVDHSLPSSAEVRNEWSCTSSCPTCFHVVDRDSFISTLESAQSGIQWVPWTVFSEVIAFSYIVQELTVCSFYAIGISWNVAVAQTHLD